VLGRYSQIRPKFLFAETEVVFAGKTIDLIPKVSQIAKDLITHGLERIILLPSSKSGKEVAESKVAGIPKRYECYIFFPRPQT